MKFNDAIPVSVIAEMIQAKIVGNGSQMATGINEIHKVTPGDIAFVDVSKYFKKFVINLLRRTIILFDSFRLFNLFNIR